MLFDFIGFDRCLFLLKLENRFLSQRASRDRGSLIRSRRRRQEGLCRLS